LLPVIDWTVVGSHGQLALGADPRQDRHVRE